METVFNLMFRYSGTILHGIITKRPQFYFFTRISLGSYCPWNKFRIQVITDDRTFQETETGFVIAVLTTK